MFVVGGTQPRAPCVGAHFEVVAGAHVHWSRQQPSKLKVGACRRVALSLAAGTDPGGGHVRDRQAHPGVLEFP